VGIYREYPLQTRLSKQPIGDFLGCGIIHSDPLKYTRSKKKGSPVHEAPALRGVQGSVGPLGVEVNKALMHQ
jgi:hypothetical protein